MTRGRMLCGVRCGLTDGDAEDVRLQLHQQPVWGHAPVHLELAEGDAAVLVHGVQDLKRKQQQQQQQQQQQISDEQGGIPQTEV